MDGLWYGRAQSIERQSWVPRLGIAFFPVRRGNGIQSMQPTSAGHQAGGFPQVLPLGSKTRLHTIHRSNYRYELHFSRVLAVCGLFILVHHWALKYDCNTSGL
jgi:hypothetical protein